MAVLEAPSPMRRRNPEPTAAPEASTVARWFERALSRSIPPMCGVAALIGVWALIAQFTRYLPGPANTFYPRCTCSLIRSTSMVPTIRGSDGTFWLPLTRVGKGFGLAAAVGIPLGFLLGRFALLNRAIAPVISLLRPVSPLAWLPIGLAIFQRADPAAMFCIFICSIWPMIINTALGVASVPQDYLNVARVLRLSEWKIFTRILLPACIPYVLSGAKLALGIAWLVIVASEMLTGGVGIGFWLWDEWNNLNMEHILIAIGVIGLVGLLLEHGMTLIADRFDYRKQ